MRLGKPRVWFGRATSALRAGGEAARPEGAVILSAAKNLMSREKTRFFAALRMTGVAIFIFQFFFAATAAAQVQLPERNRTDAVQITAQAGNRWQVGAYDVWILQGNCAIRQGATTARCGEAVLWIDRAEAAEMRPNKVIAYLEGNVDIAWDAKPGAPRLTDRTWFGRFFTTAEVDVRAGTTAGRPDVLPAIYWRGMDRRNPEVNDEGRRARVQPAQFTSPVSPAPAPAVHGAGTYTLPPGTPVPSGATLPESRPGQAVPIVPSLPGGTRRDRVFPRSDVPVQAKWFSDPATHQQIAVIDSGVNVVVEGLDFRGASVGTIDISTDRLVIWTSGQQTPDLQSGAAQDGRVPLELYMEGNIVFRQGERIIYANRMYYDVPNTIGTVLNAEILTPVQSYAGLLRLHADVVKQTGQDHFVAQNAFLTSSRMGEPGYRLQSGMIDFQDLQQPRFDPATGLPAADPTTGAPIYDHRRLATADSNFLFVGPVPIFYWPTMTADLTDPAYYLRRVRVKQDNVFGTQFLTNWSGYELLGIRNRPVGTDIDVNLDYLSKRGFGHGGSFSYDRDIDLFGFGNRTAGLLSYWGIFDNGLDNLGQDRMNLQPEKDYRFRLFWQHREELPFDIQLSAELGWISDRNFLEEYYKSEWEELKDESTGVELKRIRENRSLSLTLDYGLNGFFTHTDWLPRLDHFWLGQPLFDNRLVWYEHSSAAYGRFRELQPPGNINDQPFNYLPWEANPRQGERFATKNELDLPFQLGPVKVVPYIMGEAAHWGQDINGQPLDRLWGQAGIRASIPFWRLDPTIESELLNVHGIMHKIILDAEFYAADSSRNLDDLPLYDPLDDDSIEAFRRHYLTNTFGIPSYSPLPFPPGTPWVKQFDERYYALRTGLQNWVTSPSTEVADDLMAVRLGAHQRWQTKRGAPGNMRTVDWVTFDTNLTLFPNADRDNFGQTAGLLDYDFTWHVGDKLTMVSDGIFDFFDNGQKIVTVGGFLSRPPRGSLYAGFRILQGPIDAKILALSFTYLMSPKWASTFGTSIDFGAQRSYSQNFSLTRIGESFLINFGFTVDPARDSVGVALAVEPRFLPKNRLGNLNGVQIPPAGALGLE